jgi:hypothetical protein
MGPFIISEIRSGGIYQIRELDGTPKATLYPGERLKKFVHRYHPDKDLFLGPLEDDGDSNDDEDSIVIELDVPSDFENDDEGGLPVLGFSHQLEPVSNASESTLGFTVEVGLDA